MNEPRRISRRIRHEVDEPGLKLNLAADVNIVISGSGDSASSRQQVHVRQGRSARTGPSPDNPSPDNPSPDKKEQS